MAVFSSATYNGTSYTFTSDSPVNRLRSSNGSGAFAGVEIGAQTITLATGEVCEYMDGVLDVPPPDAGTGGSLCTDDIAGAAPTDAELFAALGGTPDIGGAWTNVGNIYTYTVTHSYFPCIVEESVVVFNVVCVCYPLTTVEANAQPGAQHVNPASCDIDPGEPTAVIEVPTFACGDNPTPVTYETTILPNNPSVLYHYWGNCAPLSPCLLYTSPSPRDATLSRMPSSA